MEPYVASKYPEQETGDLDMYGHEADRALPAALGIKNGDVNIAKNAGGVEDMYGSVMRSLLIAVLTLGVEEIMVIGHTDCGVQGMIGEQLLKETKGERDTAGADG